MAINERRKTGRYELNYPILLTDGTATGGRVHLAQVLDAGTDGLRLLLAGADPLQVNSELNLACSPARDSGDDQGWHPVHLRCKVAWRDLENNQVGLAYIQ
jgi:hypothetical protein